jgi:hypothetical protein
LEEIPSWGCCEQGRCNLCVESVEDVAPIDGLRSGVSSAGMRRLGEATFHMCCVIFATVSEPER